MAMLRVSLLGGFDVRWQDRTRPIVFRTRKAKALVAYVAMHPGLTHSRDKIANLLWSGSGPDQARHSLRQLLVGLRKQLSRKGIEVLIGDGDTLSFDAKLVQVDVSEFVELATSESAARVMKATEIYAGPFLDGLNIRAEGFEDWTQLQRAQLNELAIEAFAKSLRETIAAKKVDQAIQLALKLLALDPLEEEVHRALMELYAASGRREAAMKHYMSCRSLLHRELGIEPSEETSDLYRRIRGSVSPRTRRAGSAGSARVLVVEDDPVSRTLLERYLTRESFEVVVAEDGVDALAKLGKNEFDLVLTDIRMPRLSGLQLLEEMRKEGIVTPAIFLTAMTDEDLEIRGLKLGAADYIRKPIRKDILLLRVRNALRRAE